MVSCASRRQLLRSIACRAINDRQQHLGFALVRVRLDLKRQLRGALADMVASWRVDSGHAVPRDVESGLPSTEEVREDRRRNSWMTSGKFTPFSVCQVAANLAAEAPTKTEAEHETPTYDGSRRADDQHLMGVMHHLRADTTDVGLANCETNWCVVWVDITFCAIARETNGWSA